MQNDHQFNSDGFGVYKCSKCGLRVAAGSVMYMSGDQLRCGKTGIGAVAVVQTEPECKCDAQQLLSVGHSNSCKYPRKKW